MRKRTRGSRWRRVVVIGIALCAGVCVVQMAWPVDLSWRRGLASYFDGARGWGWSPVRAGSGVMVHFVRPRGCRVILTDLAILFSPAGPSFEERPLPADVRVLSEEYEQRHPLTDEEVMAVSSLGWPFAFLDVVSVCRAPVVIRVGMPARMLVWPSIPGQVVVRWVRLAGSIVVWAGITIAASVGSRSVMSQLRMRKGGCAQCGYSLVGIPGDVCPECGSGRG